MHKYEVALMMNEKRLTNSFKSYIGLDNDEQVINLNSNFKFEIIHYNK